MSEPINLIQIDRYWFLTWTTYGTWLPGDERGYVGTGPDVSGDPSPEKILGDLKAYASRRLNREWGTAEGGWWTESGSKRKLNGASSAEGAVNYIRQQPNPLLNWTRDDGEIVRG